jgi:hypothetical protein
MKSYTDIEQSKKLEMATIKWYKLKCSFYKQTIGFKTWQDIIDFMSKNIGFNYTIEGQYSEPFIGTDVYYDTKTKTFEKL